MKVGRIIEDEGEGDMVRKNYCKHAKDCVREDVCASRVSHVLGRPACFGVKPQEEDARERDEKNQLKLFEAEGRDA